MIVGLNAGFDGGISSEDRTQIAGLKFVGIRRDVTIERAAEWLGELTSSGYILAILRSGFDCSADQMVAESTILARALAQAGLVGRCGIEPGNEPNISKTWANVPSAFRAVVNACAAAIWAVDPRIEVISGGVSNTGWREQEWLAKVVPDLHEKVIVGYHTYRTEDPPETPRDYFASRDAEDAALRAIFGNRRRMLTEFGWESGPWKKKVLPPSVPTDGSIPYKILDKLKFVPVKGTYTYEDQAKFTDGEISRAIGLGAEAAFLYQLNSGPGDVYGPGIRFEDHSPKPVAFVAEKFWTPVEVPNTIKVSFSVEDEHGTPIDGAVMRAIQDDPAGTVLEATSNEHGAAVFTSSTPGWGCWVRFEKQGFDPLEERRIIPSQSIIAEPSWRTVLKRPVVTLQVLGPAGIPGAAVLIEHDSEGSSPHVTDDNGCLEYQSDVPGWGVWVTLNEPGYQPFHERRTLPMVSGTLPAAILQPLKKPLPPKPTRAQVCQIRTQLQGLTYHTRDYGSKPGPFFWSSYADRATSVYPAHRAVGDTHLPVGVSGSYNEPSTMWPPEITKGGDSTNNLPAFKALLREVIDEGFFCDVPLSGDGNSVRMDGSTIHYGEYSDPVGSTYGYEWLMQNVERILKAVRGDSDSECPDGEDLTPYCIFRPGWDGVFYGWSEPASIPPGTPPNVVIGGVKLWQLGQLFRRVLPHGYLAVEHNIGHIPAGGADRDYNPGGCMTDYDTILSEFGAVLEHNEAVWQIAGRLLGPAYRRPADQPPESDPHGAPWYLKAGTARGPYFAVAYEYDTYMWARGWDPAYVAEDRAYLLSLGYAYVC